MDAKHPTPLFDPDAASSDTAGIFGLETSAADAAIVMVPVPFDATTSYGHGAHRGPAAILEASHQIDLFDVELGTPYQAGIHMLPIDRGIEALNAQTRTHVEACRAATGDATLRADHLAAVNAAGDAVHSYLGHEVETYLAQGKLVAVVGGDHSVPLATIEAHVRRYPDVGILHIDAHADLRDAYEGFVHSHASIMHNVITRTQVKKLVQVGLRDVGSREVKKIAGSAGRIVAFYEHELAQAAMRGEPFLTTAARIVNTLPKHVYISLDIDGLDPSFCPHTGTPVPGGLSFRETCALFAEVVRSGRTIVGFDLMEVAPGEDGGTWDANVGARLLYKLCGYALKSREPATP